MLTSSEIKKQISLGNIEIENLSPNAFFKPNSVDVTIGNILYTYDDNFLVDMSKNKDYLSEVLYDKPNTLKKNVIPETGFTLQPNKIYLAKTTERIKTHGYVPALYGMVSFSLIGLGIDLTCAYYEDEIDSHLLVTLVATKETTIYPDIKIGNLCFFKSMDNCDYVNGIYQTGMLSGNEIKRRMQESNPDIVIRNPENTVLNPNSVNLTLNKTIGHYVDDEFDIKYKPTVKYEELDKKGIILQPNEIYVARTNEWTETNNLIPMISGRSSLGRLGIHVHCSAGMGSIGYNGYWHMGIKPIQPIRIKDNNMKICQIYYFTPDGEITSTYNGCMQNLPQEEIGTQMPNMILKNRL